MKISLSKTFKFKDNDYSEFDLQLDSITGQDLIDVEEDLKRRGVTVNAWEFSRSYLVAVAARALRIPAEALKTLGAKDFTALINEVLSFLAGTASENTTQESSAK